MYTVLSEVGGNIEALVSTRREGEVSENAIDHGTLTNLSVPDVPGPSAMRTPPRSKRARVEGVRGSTPRRRRRIDTPMYQACNSKVATCSIPNCCGE